MRSDRRQDASQPPLRLTCLRGFLAGEAALDSSSSASLFSSSAAAAGAARLSDSRFFVGDPCVSQLCSTSMAAGGAATMEPSASPLASMEAQAELGEGVEREEGGEEGEAEAEAAAAAAAGC